MTDAAESPDRRIRLTLHYDGAGFAGWQLQPDVRTVQGELEAAVGRLLDRPATVLAAGRTDRGVHATGQVVSLEVPARWTAAELRRALNAVLPPDVWVCSAVNAAPDFHARYDAVARGYLYRIGTGASARSPFRRRWCWPMQEPVVIETLQDAADRFPGTHSFRAFAKAGQPERGELCTVRAARWRAAGPDLMFGVVANRFLHHMVRYMVGTMVDVARGRRPAADIDALLAGAPDVETSPPAPPEGLFLTRVYYDAAELEAEEPFDEVLS